MPNQVQFNFSLFGSDAQFAAFRAGAVRLIAELGLEGNVQALGQIDHDEPQGPVLERERFIITDADLSLDVRELLACADGEFNASSFERTRNCLLRAQIYTLGELLQKTADDLLAITNFGQKSLDLVIMRLTAMGLTLLGNTPLDEAKQLDENKRWLEEAAATPR